MKREQMKVILLLMLSIGLGVYTYWTVEVPMQKELTQTERERALYDLALLGDLKAIQLPRVTLTQKAEKWFVDDRRASVENTQALLELLSNLEVVRRLENPDALIKETAFPLDVKLEFQLHFEKGNLQFTIGEKSKVDESFYVKMQHDQKIQWLMVRDASLQEKALTEELYRLNPMKYHRLRAMLQKERDFFDDLALFSEEERKKVIQKVSISTFRNLAFHIDVEKKETRPTALTNMRSDPRAIDEFIQRLSNLEANAIYRPMRFELLKKPLGEIKIQYVKNEMITLKIFQDYGKLHGFFVVLDESPILYEFSHAQIPLLIPSLQQFWDRRPFSLVKNENIEDIKNQEFDIQFAQTDSQHLRIPFNENFVVERTKQGAQPIHQSFAQLFGLMFSPAERVSLLDLFERKEIVDIVKSKHAALQLKFHDQDIRIEEREGELRVINLSHGLIFHYPQGADYFKLGLNPQDYFLF